MRVSPATRSARSREASRPIAPVAPTTAVCMAGSESSRRLVTSAIPSRAITVVSTLPLVTAIPFPTRLCAPLLTIEVKPPNPTIRAP